MITTVMYAETLASNLIARKNSKLFHEELFKYDVEKIIDFYNNVLKMMNQFGSAFTISSN